METAEQIRNRKYECFIEGHDPVSWDSSRCAAFAGRSLHLIQCKKKLGHGAYGLFCTAHAKKLGMLCPKMESTATDN